VILFGRPAKFVILIVCVHSKILGFQQFCEFCKSIHMQVEANQDQDMDFELKLLIKAIITFLLLKIAINPNYFTICCGNMGVPVKFHVFVLKKLKSREKCERLKNFDLAE
jgi:hypothetical protein